MTSLMSERPIAQRRAVIPFENQQLRDLVHATERAGEVLTVQRNYVMKYNVRNPDESPSVLYRLSFNPTTLAYSYGYQAGNPPLVAAGGCKANVVLLTLPSPSGSEAFPGHNESDEYSDPRSFHYDPERVIESQRIKDGYGFFKSIATTRVPQPGASIVNSVSFAPLQSDTSSLESSRSDERRLLVSSNDLTVRIYRVARTLTSSSLLDAYGTPVGLTRVREEACASFNARMNHASVSPDGRILLAAGDSPFLHLHSLSSLPNTIPPPTSPVGRGLRSSFDPLRQPRPIHVIPTSTKSTAWSPSDEHSTAEAIFSTAFSADGWKLAAGSQDGIVQVWDVRSLKQRLAIFDTASFLQSSYRWKEPYDEGNIEVAKDCPCLGKVWGVRNLRFSPSSSLGAIDRYGDNRELLIFSEHHSTLHMVDARTFDNSASSRRSLFLPSILQRHSVSSYLERSRRAKNSLVYVGRRGKKRKRDELSDSGEDVGERKRRSRVISRGTGGTFNTIPENGSSVLPVPTSVLDEPGIAAEAHNHPFIGENEANGSSVHADDGHGEPLSSLGPSSRQDANALGSQHSVITSSGAPLSPQFQLLSGPSEEGDSIRARGPFGRLSPTRSFDERIMDINRRTDEIMTSTSSLDTRLRHLSTQLQDMVNNSAGSLTSRSGSDLQPSTSGGISSSPGRLPSPLHPDRRVESPGNRLVGHQQTRPSSVQPSVWSSLSLDGSTSRRIAPPTRDRIEVLRRERPLSGTLDGETNPNEEEEGNRVLAEESGHGTDGNPSFSTDLMRRVMVRWRDGDIVGPSGDDAASPENDNIEPRLVDEDLLWASVGLDGGNATEAVPEIERWASRAEDSAGRDNGSREDTNAETASGDETIDIDEDTYTTNQLHSPVNEEVPTLLPSDHNNRAASILLSPPPREWRAVASPPQRISHLPFYQHSNRPTTALPIPSDSLLPTSTVSLIPASSFLSPPTDERLFARSPVPVQSPLPGISVQERLRSSTLPHVWYQRSSYDLRSPPAVISPRHSPYRPSLAYNPTSITRARPFSSRVFGGRHSLHVTSFHDEDAFRSEQVDGDRLLMNSDTWDEKRPVDLAGFTLGLPGTSSEGSLIVGVCSLEGNGDGRLLEFDLRGCYEDHNETDTDDARDACLDMRWRGRKYAQGGMV